MPHKVYVVEEIPAHPNKMLAPQHVEVVGAGGKPLPAAYRSTGNEALDTLAFLHILEQLKVQKRSGWIREAVREPESISDHMCRMALMAMMIPNDGERPLDLPRCVMASCFKILMKIPNDALLQMALVHDLAEAHVGDITPVEGVPAHVKHDLEEQAMESFLREMLGGAGNADARDRFRSLWNEYETRETPESRLVKDLDRLELALQAVEYERSQDIRTLHPFFVGSVPNLEHPVVQQWAGTLMAERRALWESRGRGEEERRGMAGYSVGSMAKGRNGVT